ncbi:MAG: acetyl-CoA carboxylase biotin carboxylase subunit [Sphingobacteriales bacterium]|nr:MAG: acetyl-CoA carboxylase biotin carboxylase subunit [Sphingobacteriales bacterium]
MTFMKKVLVANRGEIALRIMRSLKEMGIQTVAVYSDADRNAPFVRFADEAVHLGPPPSNQSYLLADKIIEAAQKLGVEGIHPGYGFLSENASFAEKVAAANITFIGPSVRAIEMMGNKLAAKAAAIEYKVPLLPGTAEPVTDRNEAEKIATEIGFPVLIKAAAGGGGKGMRVVNKAEEFSEQMDRAISEAMASFGDGSVFLEKYVGAPRHIEVQLLCDNHGNSLYLFERECSIQRRHQKVVEEAPSSVLTPELRRQMGESAVKIAQACQYTGAGTVEFLLDEQNNYFFLEMNTRLQVEHPVTEMITGIDLVKEQVKIARGEKLSFTQEDLKINGHAIELRIYAEDAANNFLPSTGNLKTYRTPDGPGIRVDSGYEEGMDIPVYYDPMIAKMTVHAATREEAIEKMKRAIDDYRIEGIENTLSFGKFVMSQPDFVSGHFDTGFVAKHFKPEYLQTEKEDELLAAAILSALLGQKTSKSSSTQTSTQTENGWKKRISLR